MDKVIAYVDDASSALERLQGGPRPTHWVLVACAPRMTHRISKWVSHTARENWRNKWADKLFGQVVPGLQERGDAVTTVLARGPLTELTRALIEEHGTSRVLDARRPRAPDDDASARGWGRGALLGMGALLLVGLD